MKISNVVICSFLLLSSFGCKSVVHDKFNKCNFHTMYEQVECLQIGIKNKEQELLNLQNQTRKDYSAWRRRLSDSCAKLASHAQGAGTGLESLACYDEQYTLRINELKSGSHAKQVHDSPESSLLFKAKNQELYCYSSGCMARPFTESLYEELLKGDASLSGLIMGTYYLLPNELGFKIYIAMYTDEGEIDFNYLLVSDGNETRFIQLPEVFWIYKDLKIQGYNHSDGLERTYQIKPNGFIVSD